MAQPLIHRDKHCRYAYYLTERQEAAVVEALRQFDCNGERRRSG
jgi:hypothetical protein